MFGIGGTELFIIIVFGLLVFGPDKLPQIGRTVGRAMRQFQRAQDDMTRIIKAEMYVKDPDKETSPFKPVESIFDRKTQANEEKTAKRDSDKVAPAAGGSLAASLYDLDVVAGPDADGDSRPDPETELESGPAPELEGDSDIASTDSGEGEEG